MPTKTKKPKAAVHRLQFLNSREVEYRDDGDTELGTISGYGAVFFRDNDAGTEFTPFEGHRERIDAGAFTAALSRGDDCRALFNHDAAKILGRISAGTLRLSVDRVGLRYEIDLPDTGAGRDIRESVKRGDITGSSFAFTVDDEKLTRQGGDTIRTIKSVTLFDVGPVTYPAYQGTSCSAASREWLRSQFECPRRVRLREVEASIQRDIQRQQERRAAREALVAGIDDDLYGPRRQRLAAINESVRWDQLRVVAGRVNRGR